jgi:hypothetical protein
LNDERELIATQHLFNRFEMMIVRTANEKVRVCVIAPVVQQELPNHFIGTRKVEKSHLREIENR